MDEKENVSKEVKKTDIPFNPKKIETSKVMLTLVLTVCFFLAVVIIVGWFMGLSEAPAMLAIIASPAATVITTYTIKASRENSVKLSAIYGKYYIPEYIQNMQSMYGMYSGFGGYGGYGNYDGTPYNPNNIMNNYDTNAMG